MAVLVLSRPPPTSPHGSWPPLVRTFMALFAVSSLLGLLFLSEESHTLQRFRHTTDGGGIGGRNASSSSSSQRFFSLPLSWSSRDDDNDTNPPVDDEYNFDGDDDVDAAGAFVDGDDTAALSSSGTTPSDPPRGEFPEDPGWWEPAIPTWADTDEGRGCRSLLPLRPIDGRISRTLSPSVLWTLLGPRVLNASYYPPMEHGKSDGFRRYVNTIFTFYTSARLRRSTSHPAPTASMRRILALVDNYKRQRELYNHHQQQQLLQSNASSASQDGLSVSPPQPIRVLVLGGSVVKGTNALASSEVWLGRKPGTPESYYAWPARLEHLLNGIFFPADESENEVNSTKGFVVNNYAMGATNSEVGAAMLEYQLVPGLDRNPPDIVIASYSTNDARDPDRNATYYVHLQNLVRAAHSTRPCDDDLPLVILADDMHGLLDEDPALEITGSLYKLASWYNVMAVAFGNVARHASIASYVNLTVANPLLGNPYNNLHHGVGMHIGIAWTLVFNLLTAFQDTCSDAVVGGMDDTNAFDRMDSMKWSLVEPPTKYQGRISPMDVASREWKDRIAWKDTNCPLPLAESPPYSTSVCTYAWSVNPATISTPLDIDAALEPVLVQIDGWRADYFNNGTVFRSPGFGTETPGSSFALAVRNVTQDTNFVTIFSMSSYGPGFTNSVLRLTARIDRRATTTNGESNNNDDDEVATYDVKGSHDLRTSVFFPHKFRLPGSGARAGDTIRLDAHLVSGRAFKIQAVAFCRS